MTPASPSGMSQRTEKQVERECDEIMTTLGFTVIRFSQPRNTMQTAGIPDRKYYHAERGCTLWFECKRPGGKQSPGQELFQYLAESCGEQYVLGGRAELGRALCRSMRLITSDRHIRLLAQLFPEHLPPSFAHAR